MGKMEKINDKEHRLTRPLKQGQDQWTCSSSNRRISTCWIGLLNSRLPNSRRKPKAATMSTFDGAPTPCAPIDGRFKWGQIVVVKPPA